MTLALAGAAVYFLADMNAGFRRGLWFIPSALWASFIFWLSTRPVGVEPPPWFLSNDKVVHGVLFGILASLLFLGLRRAAGLPARRAAVIALVAASLYGLTDEWHQRYVPTRDSDAGDWLADTVGATLFLLPALAYPMSRTRHEAIT